MPEISIVIASFSGLQTLEQCLGSLRPREGGPKFLGEPEMDDRRHAECTHEASGLCVKGPSVADDVRNEAGLGRIGQISREYARDDAVGVSPELFIARPCDDSVQVVVASNLPADQLASIAQRWSNVHFVSEPGADVFRLRTVGVQAATGEVIAMTEDHVTFSPQWLNSIRQGIQEHPIVGGPIENGLSGIWDWALFACEYITFLPAPSEASDGGATPAGVLSGVNIAYRRKVLESCSDVWRRYFRENEVHDALGEKGYTLHRLPEAIVSSHLEMTLVGAMDHLFTGAKHYGRYRKGWETGPRRRLLLLTVLLVPAVLLWRILRAVLSRRPQRLGTIILGLPMILCLIAAWSCGEAIGYASSPLQSQSPRMEEAHENDIG
jgi:hypothetical protein